MQGRTSFLTQLVLGTVGVAGSFWLATGQVQALQVSPPKQSFVVNPGDVIETQIKILGTGGGTEQYTFTVESFRKVGEENEREFYIPEIGTQNIVFWTLFDTSQPQSIELTEWKEYPVKIYVPLDAPPGGHYLAIVATIGEYLSPEQTSVGTESRIAGQILVRVNGDVTENLDIASFATLENQRLFAHRPVEFVTRIRNNGNVHLLPKGFVEVFSFWNQKKITTLKINEHQLEAFPETTRRYYNIWQADPEFVMPEGLPWHRQFLVHALYELQHPQLGFYTARAGIAFGDPQQSAQASTWFIVFPWHLVLLVLGTIFLLWLIGRIRRWLVKKWTDFRVRRQLQRAARG
jgi:hypothetical protein